MGERVAGHDADHQRLHAIAVLGDWCCKADRQRPRRSLPTGGTARRPAVCRSGCGRSHRSRAAMIRLSSAGVPKRFASRQLAGGVDRAAGVVPVAPAPDGVEVLQAEADGVEDLVAVGAHRVGTMQSPCVDAASGWRSVCLVLFFQRRDIGRRRRNVLAEDLFQHPHAAIHRAGAIGE